MEDVSINEVIDVPDTPDQLVTRNMNHGQTFNKGAIPTVVIHSGNSNSFRDGLIREKSRNRLITKNGPNRKLCLDFHRDQRNPVKPEQQFHACHSTSDQHVDKGKALSTSFLLQSSACHHDKAVLDLIERSKREQEFQDGVIQGTLVDLMDKEINVGSLQNIDCSVKESNRYAFKGDTSCVDRGNEIDIPAKVQLKAEKNVSGSLSNIPSHRVTGKRKLVRNGCISQNNIAMSKQSIVKYSNNPKGLEHNGTITKCTVINAPPHVISLSNLVAEKNNSNISKGKGVATLPSTSKEPDPGTTIYLSKRNLTIHKNSPTSPEELGGWRTTHNRSKETHISFSDEPGKHFITNDRYFPSGTSNKTDFDHPEVWDSSSCQNQTAGDSSQYASNLISESRRVNERHSAANTIDKMKQMRSPNHSDQCSTPVCNDLEITFIGSSEESSISRSMEYQNQNRNYRRVLDPIIQIDNSPFEMRHDASHDIVCMSDSDSQEIRAMQLEADEILATKLQEQLYNDLPVFSGNEQAEVVRASSSDTHLYSLRSGPLTSRLQRQSQSRSSQNCTVRRGGRIRAPASARMAQLRRRFRIQTPATIPEEMSFPFPEHMDWNMRLDILEALEASSELNNTGTTTNILQMQRDFNENDYEMLLALDEDNHEHGGAPVNQINRLPQSTVQTDNFEEACSVCLEIPTIGDIIRHLPCLHKFHKNCIDPWLHRRTSCPVCKSSIT